MPFIAAGASLLGGYLQGKSAEKAARTQADAQLEAARLAAEEARFRPVGITTRFGRSAFETGPDGRVSGASYTLDPALRAFQDRFMGLAGGGLDRIEAARERFAPVGAAGEGLFNLGAGFLSETPQEAARRFMDQQQELLAPSRERQMAQLQQGLFNTGRGGLAVGATGARPSGAMGLGAASPELEAYYNAIAQQDAQLAADATRGGMDMTRFGAGLFATGGNLIDSAYRGEVAALGPYEAYFEQMRQLEALGQQPLELGSALGGRVANPTGANALLAGGTGAARSNFSANAFNPFATALVGASQNPQLMDALRRSTAPPATGFNYNPSGGAYGFTYQDPSAVGPFIP